MWLIDNSFFRKEKRRSWEYFLIPVSIVVDRCKNLCGNFFSSSSIFLAVISHRYFWPFVNRTLLSPSLLITHAVLFWAGAQFYHVNRFLFPVLSLFSQRKLTIDRSAQQIRRFGENRFNFANCVLLFDLLWFLIWPAANRVRSVSCLPVYALLFIRNLK